MSYLPNPGTIRSSFDSYAEAEAATVLAPINRIFVGDLCYARDAINMSQGKSAQTIVRNSTDNKLYYATGATATSPWISADGATTITPT